MSRTTLVPVSLWIFSLLLSPAILSATPVQWWTVSQASAQIPLGSLPTVAKGGVGAALGVDAFHLGLDNLVLSARLEYVNLTPNSSKISSIQQAGFMATGGYRFPLTEDLAVTPQAGVGYCGVFTKGAKSGAGTQVIAQLGIGGSWSVDTNWRFDAEVAYRGIAESVAWYSGITFGLGVAYHLPIDTP